MRQYVQVCVQGEPAGWSATYGGWCLATGRIHRYTVSHCQISQNSRHYLWPSWELGAMWHSAWWVPSHFHCTLEV